MAEDFDLSGYTLFERQSMFYNGTRCVYCLGYCDFVDSIEIYKHTSYGMAYWCKSCNVWVGTHRGNDQALGTVASKPLRELRNLCHQKFDPLCEAKMRSAGLKKKGAKAAGYKWLAEILGINVIECHIGFFNIAKCKIVIAECEKVYEAAKKTADMTKFKVDCVNWNSEELGYEVKEFKMNNLWQLTLTQEKSGKSLEYKPKENLVKWAGKKSKWQLIEEIEPFLFANFK
jgi:hypothetical protein